MKKDLSIFNQRISKKGVFDLNKMIKDMKDILKDNKYLIVEKQNTSKNLDKGVENLLDFIAIKEIDDFYEYRLEVSFLITSLAKVTVKEKKLDKGELEVRMKAKLRLDHNNKFHGWFGNFLFKIYITYIIKDQINKVYVTKVYLEGRSVFDLLKHDMDLY